MSTPYPPQPRRLMRDPSNKLIGGVCSGLAKYLNMDVNLIRILTVVISLFTGVPIVLYLIALFVLPEERPEPPQPPYVNGPSAGAYGAAYQQPGQGAQPPANDVWGPDGAPWEQEQPVGASTPPVPTPEPTAPEPTRVDPGAATPTGYDTAPADAASADTVPPDAGSDDAGSHEEKPQT